MKNQKFRKLEIWNKSMDLIEEIYRVTEKFPAKEVYGLTSQLRQAATSVALNIAEGSAAGSDNEFNRFLSIAHRSNHEVMCGLEIAKRLEYLRSNESDPLLERSDELSAMITGFKKKLKAAS
ncbi:MAG: four helix bundle protein [Candidatus Omnitrophota bacterium]